MLSGIVISPGLALGQAICLFEPDYRELLSLVEKKIPGSAAEEVARFREAQATCLASLQVARDQAAKQSDQAQVALFEAHQLLLSDETLRAKIEKQIEQANSCAEAAVHVIFQAQIDQMASRKDAYLKERAADLEDLSRQLLTTLLGITQGDDATFNPTSSFVLAVRNLTPKQLVRFGEHAPLAILSQEGSRSSHAAIMARSLGIPAILGITSLTQMVKTGDWVFVNASENVCEISPDEAARKRYQAQITDYHAYKATLDSFKDLPAVTIDNHRIEMLANIAHPGEVEKALEHGVEGVGLFRTEFLFIGQRTVPGEKEQTECYTSILQQLPSKIATIRTLDIGGDKPLAYLQTQPENNPFLGLRGIRLCLANEGLFRVQLKAICRAACSGTIKLMLPMVSCLEEWFDTKRLLESIQQELASTENLSTSGRITLGIMVETPAAIMMAAQFAEHVDFFSVGTNDLVQYIMAVDRTNASVGHLYQPFSPAIVKALHDLVVLAHARGKPVSICGEMGSDPLAIPLLVGLGFDALSMNPFFVLESKKLIRTLRYSETQKLVQKALACQTGGEVKQVLEAFQSRLNG